MTRLAQHAVDSRDHFLRDLAAEFDVHTAACHVGGNRHRAERARARNDLRLFGMLARIQHLMRHAALQDRL